MKSVYSYSNTMFFHANFLFSIVQMNTAVASFTLQRQISKFVICDFRDLIVKLMWRKLELISFE